MAPIRWKLTVREYSGRTNSGLFFFFDAVADDVGHVRIAFVLLFDKGGIVEALVGLDFLLAVSGRAFSRLLTLLFGLGIFQRDEFSVRRLRHDRFNLRHQIGRAS